MTEEEVLNQVAEIKSQYMERYVEYKKIRDKNEKFNNENIKKALNLIQKTYESLESE